MLKNLQPNNQNKPLLCSLGRSHLFNCLLHFSSINVIFINNSNLLFVFFDHQMLLLPIVQILNRSLWLCLLFVVAAQAPPLDRLKCAAALVTNHRALNCSSNVLTSGDQVQQIRRNLAVLPGPKEQASKMDPVMEFVPNGISQI